MAFTLCVTGVSEPISMAVYPKDGLLFWLDRGGRNGVSPKVGKVNMDGSQPEVIVSKNLQSPEVLTIDIQKEVLYFSTSHGDAKIESCNLDGTNRQVSHSNTVAHRFNLKSLWVARHGFLALKLRPFTQYHHG